MSFFVRAKSPTYVFHNCVKISNFRPKFAQNNCGLGFVCARVASLLSLTNNAR